MRTGKQNYIDFQIALIEIKISKETSRTSQVPKADFKLPLRRAVNGYRLRNLRGQGRSRRQETIRDCLYAAQTELAARGRLSWRPLSFQADCLRCRLLALPGHAAMSELSPLSGVNRTSGLRPPTSDFDPSRTLTFDYASAVRKMPQIDHATVAVSTLE